MNPSPSGTNDAGDGPSVAKATARPEAQDSAVASEEAPPPLAPDPLPRLLSPIGREALPPVLTADELAALLRVNRKTVYAGFRSGHIPGGQRIRGAIRFSRDAVLRWLAEGQVPRSSRGPR